MQQQQSTDVHACLCAHMRFNGDGSLGMLYSSFLSDRVAPDLYRPPASMSKFCKIYWTTAVMWHPPPTVPSAAPPHTAHLHAQLGAPAAAVGAVAAAVGTLIAQHAADHLQQAAWPLLRVCIWPVAGAPMTH